MYIKNLALMNYRNYESAKITFSEGINILYGDNAQGKTNILEAIFVAGTTTVSYTHLTLPTICSV